MALKSNREGLRKESVDYLGNLIIDENLKEKIFNSIDSFIKIDLLWTNANTSNDFEGQTISLNLSQYKFVYISFVEESVKLICKIGEIGSVKNSSAYNSSRDFSIYEDRIVINSAIRYLNYGNWEATNINADLKPYKIYGVK